MSLTPNYGMNIPASTDTVNLLTQNYPNFNILDTALKSVSDSAVTVAVETKVGTVHNLVRSDSDRAVIRFTATSDYIAGDTFTVDGNAVTVVTPGGTSIPDRGFVINSNVLGILVGAVLTLLVGGGLTSVDASDVDYDNTGSGLTATDVQNAIDELATRPVVTDASDVDYDNTVSGLTATDVQSAIDELKALIPATPQYVVTGLSPISNISILSGGYYVDNGIVHVDITVMFTGTVPAIQGLVFGFPESDGVNTTSPYNVVPFFDNSAIFHSARGGQTGLLSNVSHTTGDTIHYIGSYALYQP